MKNSACDKFRHLHKRPKTLRTLRAKQNWCLYTGKMVRPIKRPDGTWEWWQHGIRHREDGPAIKRPDGAREWWQHGIRHREDGPAIKRPGGAREWWQHGHCVKIVFPRRSARLLKMNKKKEGSSTKASDRGGGAR